MLKSPKTQTSNTWNQRDGGKPAGSADSPLVHLGAKLRRMVDPRQDSLLPGYSELVRLEEHTTAAASESKQEEAEHYYEAKYAKFNKDKRQPISKDDTVRNFLLSNNADLAELIQQNLKKIKTFSDNHSLLKPIEIGQKLADLDERLRNPQLKILASILKQHKQDMRAPSHLSPASQKQKMLLQSSPSGFKDYATNRSELGAESEVSVMKIGAAEGRGPTLSDLGTLLEELESKELQELITELESKPPMLIDSEGELDFERNCSKTQERPSLNELLHLSVEKNDREAARRAEQKMSQMRTTSLTILEKRLEGLVGTNSEDKNEETRSKMRAESNSTRMAPTSINDYNVNRATEPNFGNSPSRRTVHGFDQVVTGGSRPEKKDIPSMRQNALKNQTSPNSSYRYSGLEEILSATSNQFNLHEESHNSEEDDITDEKLRKSIKHRKLMKATKRERLQTVATAVTEAIKSVEEVRSQIKTFSLVDKEVRLDELREKYAELREKIDSPEVLPQLNDLLELPIDEENQATPAQLSHQFSFSQLQKDGHDFCNQNQVNESGALQDETESKESKKSDSHTKSPNKKKGDAADSQERDLVNRYNFKASFIGHISSILSKKAEYSKKMKTLDPKKSARDILINRVFREQQLGQAILRERSKIAQKLAEDSSVQLSSILREAQQLNNASMTSLPQFSTHLSASNMPTLEVGQTQSLSKLMDQAERSLVSPVTDRDQIIQSAHNKLILAMPTEIGSQGPESQTNLTIFTHASQDKTMSPVSPVRPTLGVLEGFNAHGDDIAYDSMNQVYTAQNNLTNQSLANIQQIPLQQKMAEISSTDNAHIGSSTNCFNQVTGQRQSPIDTQLSSMSLIASPLQQISNSQEPKQTKSKLQSQSQQPDLLQKCRKGALKQPGGAKKLPKLDSSIRHDQSSKQARLARLQQSVNDLFQMNEVSSDFQKGDELLRIISGSNSETQLKFKPPVKLSACQEGSNSHNMLFLQNQQQQQTAITSHTSQTIRQQQQQQINLLTETADDVTLGTLAEPAAAVEREIDSSIRKTKRQLTLPLNDKDEAGLEQDEFQAPCVLPDLPFPTNFLLQPPLLPANDHNLSASYPEDIFIPHVVPVDNPLNEIVFSQTQAEPDPAAAQPIRVEHVVKSSSQSQTGSVERPSEVDQTGQKSPGMQQLRQTQFSMPVPGSLENGLNSQQCWDFRLKMQKRFGFTMTALHKSNNHNIAQSPPESPLNKDFNQSACEDSVHPNTLKPGNAEALTKGQAIEQKQVCQSNLKSNELPKLATNVTEGSMTAMNLREPVSARQQLIDFAPLSTKNFEYKNHTISSFSPKTQAPNQPLECHPELKKVIMHQLQERKRKGIGEAQKATLQGAVLAEHGLALDNLIQQLNETDTKDFMQRQQQAPLEPADNDKDSQPPNAKARVQFEKVTWSGIETQKLRQSECYETQSHLRRLQSSASPTDLSHKGNSSHKKHKKRQKASQLLVEKSMHPKDALNTVKCSQNRHFNFSNLQSTKDPQKSQYNGSDEHRTQKSGSNLCIDASVVQPSQGGASPSQLSNILTPHLQSTNVKIALQKEKSKRIQQILKPKHPKQQQKKAFMGKNKVRASSKVRLCDSTLTKLQSKLNSPFSDQECDKEKFRNSELFYLNQSQQHRMPFLTPRYQDYAQPENPVVTQLQESLQVQALRKRKNFSKNLRLMKSKEKLGALGQILVKASENAVADATVKEAMDQNRGSFECANLLLQCDEEDDIDDDNETTSSPFQRGLKRTQLPQKEPQTNGKKSRQDHQSGTEEGEREQILTAKGWTSNRTQERYHMEDVLGIRSNKSENEGGISEEQQRIENDIKEMQSLLPPLLETHSTSLFFKEDDIDLSDEDCKRARKRIKEESIPFMYVKGTSDLRTINGTRPTPINIKSKEFEALKKKKKIRNKQARVQVRSPLQDEKFHLITVSPAAAARQKFFLGVQLQLSPNRLSVLQENPRSEIGAISLLEKSQGGSSMSRAQANMQNNIQKSSQEYEGYQNVPSRCLAPLHQTQTQTSTIHVTTQPNAERTIYSERLSPQRRHQLSPKKQIKIENNQEKRIANNFTVTVKNNLNSSVDQRSGILSPALGDLGLSVKQLTYRDSTRNQQTTSCLSPLINKKDHRKPISKKSRVSNFHITQKIPNALIASSDDLKPQVIPPSQFLTYTQQLPAQYELGAKTHFRDTFSPEQSIILDRLPAPCQKVANRTVTGSVDFKSSKKFRFINYANNRLATLKLPPVGPINSANLSYDLNVLKQEYNRKLERQAKKQSASPPSEFARKDTITTEKGRDLGNNGSGVLTDRSSQMHVKDDDLSVSSKTKILEKLPTAAKETPFPNNTTATPLNEDLPGTFSTQLVSQRTSQYRGSRRYFSPPKTQTMWNDINPQTRMQDGQLDQSKRRHKVGSAHRYGSNNSRSYAQTKEGNSRQSMKEQFDIDQALHAELEIGLATKQEIMLNEHAMTMARLKVEEAEQVINDSCYSKPPISFSGQNDISQSLCVDKGAFPIRRSPDHTSGKDLKISGRSQVASYNLGSVKKQGTITRMEGKQSALLANHSHSKTSFLKAQVSQKSDIQ